VRSCLELSAKIVLEVTLFADELNVGTVLDHTLLILQLLVSVTVHVGETPLLGDNDLLATGEFVAGTAQSLLDDGTVVVLAADGHDNLANVHAGDGSVGLSPGTSHTSLESISSSTGQHLVDADDMEGVDADTHVEGVFARGLGHVLVGANTGSLEGFTGQLLILIGDKMATERELVNSRTLATKIVNTDLGVGHTTVVARLGVGFVLAVAVTPGGTATHFDR